MKPRPFDYVRPDTTAEAVSLLSEFGDEARILAGGQSLMPMMNLRLAGPAMLVDITRIKELDQIRDLGAQIEVGAAVTQSKLLAWPELRNKSPLLALMLPFVGHFQTRNKGTVCGSVAHADPSSEIPLSLATLEGEVVLRSARGDRVLSMDDFQVDMLTTACEADELVVAVRFPADSDCGVAFREVALRHGDFAMVAVAAILESKDIARIGIGGVAPTPVVRRIAPDSVNESVEELLLELEDYEDLHASAGLRRDLLRNLAPVVIAEAKKCAA